MQQLNAILSEITLHVPKKRASNRKVVKEHNTEYL